MEIVLQPDVLLIRTGFSTLETEWMGDFLTSQSEHMLYLPRAVLVLHSGQSLEIKKYFFECLCDYYAETHDLDKAFFLRALNRCLTKPVKIELDRLEGPETIQAELYAHNAQTVSVLLEVPNRWVISYLRSQLSPYVLDSSVSEVVVDVSGFRAKARLERALNRRHLLHYSIQYCYDAHFLQRLYANFADFDFDDTLQREKIDIIMHYYTVLKCPVGASQDALKKSYKKLVKVYHPDRVYSEDDTVVSHYTQKFQLLQEAYEALRIVS